MFSWFSFLNLDNKIITKLSKLNINHLDKAQEDQKEKCILIYPTPDQYFLSIKDDLITNDYENNFSFLDDKFIELNTIYKDTISFKNENSALLISLWHFESLSIQSLDKYISNSDESEIIIESSNLNKDTASFELLEVLKIYMIKKYPEIIKNYHRLESLSTLFGRQLDNELFDINEEYLNDKYLEILKNITILHKEKNNKIKKLKKLKSKIIEADENLNDFKMENIFLRNKLNELEEQNRIDQISICELQEEIERQYHNLILRDKLILNQSKEINRTIESLITK